MKLSRNFGEHAALLAGLSVCTGDCAVTKQADLQEDRENAKIVLKENKSLADEITAKIKEQIGSKDEILPL